MAEQLERDFGMISIIIASYNSSNVITACLDSLRKQATSHSFEIVVADSSVDGTVELIEEKYPEVKLVKLSQRTYPGPARNAAVQASKGEILAFLDTDCTVPPDWVDRIVIAHNDGWRVVGGAVLNGTQHSYVGTAEHISEFSEYSYSKKAQECRMIPTCNLSIRREIFDAVGKFESVNTGTTLFKSEDLLLCHRVTELGYSLRFNPNIKVYHHNRVELRHFLGNQLSLGFSSVVVRRLVSTKGSILVKYVSLSTLIPVVKTAILIRRMASYSVNDFLNLLFHLPLIFVGSCFYTVGFIRGSKTPLKKLSIKYGQK